MARSDDSTCGNAVIGSRFVDDRRGHAGGNLGLGDHRRLHPPEQGNLPGCRRFARLGIMFQQGALALQKLRQGGRSAAPEVEHVSVFRSPLVAQPSHLIRWKRLPRKGGLGSASIS
jgi:hypothetical protein